MTTTSAGPSGSSFKHLTAAFAVAALVAAALVAAALVIARLIGWHGPSVVYERAPVGRSGNWAAYEHGKFDDTPAAPPVPATTYTPAVSDGHQAYQRQSEAKAPGTCREPLRVRYQPECSSLGGGEGITWADASRYSGLPGVSEGPMPTSSTGQFRRRRRHHGWVPAV